MSIYVDNLEPRVMANAASSDEIIIISGFFSIDIIENIARKGIPTVFYYGMYLRNGISTSYYNSFKRLEATYPNLKINIPIAYHVHTKCYIFRQSGVTANALVGSANASTSALATTPNSELLTPIVSTTDRLFLDKYVAEIDSASVHFDNPIIIPSAKTKALSVSAKRSKKAPKSWNNYTGNPFSAIIFRILGSRSSPVCTSYIWVNHP